MPTEAQINANRLNAQKSTGPTSPEGKARSAMNALKSGIDAFSQIIPGEDPAELEALAALFLLHYRPTDPAQVALVDTLISTEWIQRRLRRIEAQLWHYRVECLDLNFNYTQDPPLEHSSPIGHAFEHALDPFTRLQRRIDATNRMFLRTLKALQELQAAASQSAAASDATQSARQPAPAEPASHRVKVFSEPPSTVTTQSLTPPIGFVPQSDPAPGKRPHGTLP